MARFGCFLLFSAWQAALTHGAECPEACELAFKDCWAKFCGKDPHGAHGECSRFFKSGLGNLGQKCPDATCTFTAGMEAMRTDTCPSTAECTGKCERLWMTCRKDNCKMRNNATAAASTCNGRLAQGMGVFKRSRCDPYCAATESMLSKSGQECNEVDCETKAVEKPSLPTACSPENRGCCKCIDRMANGMLLTPGTSMTSLVWWASGKQYCADTMIPPSSTPLPVVISFQTYLKDKLGIFRMIEPGDYYGFAVIVLKNADFTSAAWWTRGLSFPNNGVINSTNPTPCAAKDSPDHQYLEAIFKWIEEKSELDSTKVYVEGFSKDGTSALYASVCFASKVAGIWQGGGGMYKTGYHPLNRYFDGQCSQASAKMHKSACCEKDFCTTCQYWPIYPQTCGNKLIGCFQAYTGDDWSCGSDYFAYQAMVAEGNDARLLSFPGGRHKEPSNAWAWKVGCLGLAPPCSETCATDFKACTDELSGDGSTKFFECEKRIQDGRLSSCAFRCAPTVSMLETSEKPVISLSEGKFGGEANLPVAPNPAPRPDCEFGLLAEKPAASCTPPAGWSAPESKPASCPRTGATPESENPVSAAKLRATFDFGLLLLTLSSSARSLSY